MTDLTKIAALIENDLRFHKAGEESLAEALRGAANAVMLDFPNVTSAEFGDAAASMGLHRQGARNRFNECVTWLRENSDLVG